MRIKYLVLNILIPVCFVTGLYAVYLSVGSVKRHKSLLRYEPPRPESMQLVDSLEAYRQKYRNLSVALAPPDVVIRMGEINYTLDSITHSKAYLAETEDYHQNYQRFLKRENKLTIRYVLQVVIVVLGLGGSVYLSKRLYTLYKAQDT